ncbi:Holliday junction resolvase RuvX [Flavobacterium sp. xlx-214]|uniref:Holliday junction resolvase RuvX n=1 Tax=unclassified Flavobacterium TaxID=196869 RepID=UPI0013D35E17|nr:MULTISPECIES: Holliday junction resolvase RuvX [unclassified Flavobacterium]MBA5791806.1 Holliday junction resolvase RuvX [Flavobacterium sp. xlx-221]QMI83043.1 Holliday junction resolvase RuvX [Flavobacterium sp. xlx-214]
MAIDYGGKRTGIAVTDEMQIIASGLTTVDTKSLFSFLEDYFKKEMVSKIIVGDPKRLNNEASTIAAEINKFVEKLSELYPQIEIIRMDERFTSKIAFQTMIDGGLKKKQRQNKALVDEIAATILLQDYMSSNRF